MSIYKKIELSGVLPIISTSSSEIAISLGEVINKQKIGIFALYLHSNLQINYLIDLKEKYPDIAIGLFLKDEDVMKENLSEADFLIIPANLRMSTVLKKEERRKTLFYQGKTETYSFIPFSQEVTKEDEEFSQIILIDKYVEMFDYFEESSVMAVAPIIECESLEHLKKVQNQIKKLQIDSLGYRFEHLGINSKDKTEAKEVVALLHDTFNFPYRNLANSIFVGRNIEIMKEIGRGENGHIAIYTHNIKRAIADLKRKNYFVDTETVKYRANNIISIYLENEIGGFGVHLINNR